MVGNNKLVVTAVLAVAFMGNAQAAPIDLSSWTTDNSFDFAGAQGAGVWTVSSGGSTVTQSVNGDATMFLNPNALGNIEGLSGTFRETSTDDDFVGFVFGFQDTGSFYLFDWKQGSQTAYGFANQGITLKRFDAAPTQNSDLWQTASVPGVSTQLYHNNLIGRAQNVTYTFELDRIVSSGEITISLLQGASVLDSFTVTDSTYGTGKFGFYNFSEDSVTYSGFTADVFQSVPEPGTVALLAMAGLPLFVSRRRRRNPRNA